MFRRGVLELVCQQSPAVHGETQGRDQLFAFSPLLSSDIPEALPPVTLWRRVVVLGAHGQGPNNRVAEVALVGIVAVDA